MDETGGLPKGAEEDEEEKAMIDVTHVDTSQENTASSELGTENTIIHSSADIVDDTTRSQSDSLDLSTFPATTATTNSKSSNKKPSSLSSSATSSTVAATATGVGGSHYASITANLISSFTTAQSILASTSHLASIFPSLIIALSTAIQQLVSLPSSSHESKKSINILDLHQKIISNLVTQTQNLTMKHILDCPPYVHLSPKDCASQLYLDPNTRLSVYGSYSYGTSTLTSTSAFNQWIQSKSNNGGGNSSSSSSSSSSIAASSSSSNNNNMPMVGCGGYRTVRANAGVSSGHWYFEVLILHHPLLSNTTTPTTRHAGNTVTSSSSTSTITGTGFPMGKYRQFIQSTIPSHVRLGESLKMGVKQGLIQEEMDRLYYQKQQQKVKEELLKQDQTTKECMIPTIGMDEGTATRKKHKSTHGGNSNKSLLLTSQQQEAIFRGGHLRIGWSMRTGELQAPVGYDQWSYAYRDISGSRIHNSQREDSWYGNHMDASFRPGDVIGLAICLIGNNSTITTTNTTTSTTTISSSTASTKTNHIRFFKNGESVGLIIKSKGINIGGEAFDNITAGTYYPAVSAYMGGCCRVNFGPHFVYPLRAKALPTGMKILPMCESSPNTIPPPVEEAMDKLLREKAIFGKKLDEHFIAAFKEAARMEATLRYNAYLEHLKRHVDEVRTARLERKLNVSDLDSLVAMHDNASEKEEDKKNEDCK